MLAARMTMPLAALLLLAADGPPYDWSTADLSFFGTDAAETYKQSRAICAQLLGAEPPASDRPTAEEARSLKGCDSEALYFGIGVPADPDKARKCAFVELSNSEEGTRYGPFFGRGMLMTIYANGKGAARNLDVATHLACGLEDAPAEMAGRIEHLQKLKSQAKGEDFSPCNDVTSGWLAGMCAGHDSRLARIELDERLELLAQRGGFANGPDWSKLVKLAEAYAEAHANGEVDMTGTLRGAMWSAARDSSLDRFVETLERMTAGTIPRRGSADYAKSDAELNVTYKAVLANDENFSEASGISRESVRAAERAWLAYRDAMLSFARRRFPGISIDGLAILLTNDRIAEMTSEFG